MSDVNEGNKKNHKKISNSSTTDGLPLAPSLGPSLASVHVPTQSGVVTGRVIFISSLAVIVAFAAGFIAQILMRLIYLVTNISFYGTFNTSFVSPSENHLGWLVLIVPSIGGIIVGFMARYGSRGIRGHGIPEAMEQVLTNESRIEPRLTFLKPLSAAIAIGTGGPFGAEGPIIATGGALGSLVGQLLKTTADERKTLLAAGAAAGMAATFGSPVSAVILAIELLLFEFRPRSIIPVSLAAATATAVRIALVGAKPIFAMPNLSEPGGAALATYVILGGVVGVASVFVTRSVYKIEDMFEKLPVHWMWWPALGGVAVGVIGYFAPRTLGVGYDNIENIVSGSFALKALFFLCIFKFISWAVALGSGTSGGTLAPLFTIGGALGAVIGAGAAMLFPSFGIDVRIAALVGMAAMFSGASRALLASVVFAFETTLQPIGLLPLLGGCTAAFLASFFLMENTIMTEKIVRRGVRVPAEYSADFLDQLLVRDFASKPVVTLNADDTVEKVNAWISSGASGSHHQGFPVLNAEGHLVGVLTRRDLFGDSISRLKIPLGEMKLRDLIQRVPAAVYDDCSLREAADHMVHHSVGRLPVVSRKEPTKVVGIITRSDVLSSHRRRLDESQKARAGIFSASLNRFKKQNTTT
ncbi:MAG: chloride channel protein [Bacteroidota bacterium]|nr:chloride channel protein [Bacteroidota bacterium]